MAFELKKALRVALLGATLALPMVIEGPTPALATEIVYSVNGAALTSYDVSRRAAFLRLQGAGGGNSAATEAMIDQMLKLQEGERVGIRISNAEIDAAFQRFASSNRLSTGQLTQILGQAGVTATHFKEYIRAEMTWGQVLQLRNRRTSGATGSATRDAVARMLEQGGTKPTSTEYVLQQVVFVVPRGGDVSARARKVEADSLRSRFQSCDSTRRLAVGLIDVTVIDLGRRLEAELPSEWRDLITSASEGSTTATRTTDRGGEFIAICRARTVSDDRVAELEFNTDQLSGGGGEGSDEYLKEIRKNARIIQR